MGASRIYPEGDRRAILMHIEEDGYAVRLSVGAEPQATGMLSVKCHNGSDHLEEEIEYLPKHAGLLLTIGLYKARYS